MKPIVLEQIKMLAAPVGEYYPLPVLGPRTGTAKIRRLDTGKQHRMTNTTNRSSTEGAGPSRTSRPVRRCSAALAGSAVVIIGPLLLTQPAKDGLQIFEKKNRPGFAQNFYES